MKIGIDVSMLAYQGSGVANYTFNLVRHLLQDDSDHQYRFFYSSLRRPPGFEKLKELETERSKVFDWRLPPRVFKFLWNKNHLLPVEWLIGKVDIYHSSDYLRPPLLKGTKSITTIHDLTWKLFPEFHTDDVIQAHEKKMKKTIHYGDTIIADSQNTKRDLLRLYPEISRDKIHVLYPGISESFKPIKNVAIIKNVLTKYHIQFPKKYLLYVGAIEPRKNLDTAVKVFAKLIKNKSFADYEFLIVGRAGWKNESLFRLIKDLHLEKKVTFVGYVTDEDLPYFYNGASLLLYLSLYEGFGLPPLEALACQTPVLCLKNSSLVEILESKWLIASTNIDRILEKVQDTLSTKPAVDCKKYQEKFYWSRIIKHYLSILTDV